jgi:hypothetical protein
MPRVPSYTRQVQSQGFDVPVAPTGASPAAFGSGVGEGIQDAAATLARIQGQKREDQDGVVAGHYVEQLRAWETDAIKRIRDVRGQEVEGVADQVGAERAKLIRDVLSGVRSNSARQRMDAIFTQMGVEFGTNVLRHVSSEREAFRRDLAARKVENAAERSAAVFNDPAQVAREVERATFVAEREARRLGLTDPEQITSERRKAATVVHGATLDAMLSSGQGVAASEYLSAHRGEMEATVVSAFASKVRGMADDQQVMAAVDEAHKPGDLAATLQAIRSKHGSNPLRARVEGEAEARYRQDETIRASRERDTYSAFYPAWVAAGRKLERVAPHLRAGLTPQQRESILDQEAQDHSRAKSDAALDAQTRAALKQLRESDSSQAWGRLALRAARDPQAFSLVDLSREPDFQRLTPTDQQNILGRQASVVEELRKGSRDTSTSAETLLLEKAAQVGILSDKETSPVKRGANQAFVQLRRSFNEWRESYRIKKGQPPDVSEINEVLDRLTVKAVRDTWLPFDQKTTFAFQSAEPLDPNAVEIPEDELPKIDAALRRAGEQVTDAARRRLYLKKMGLK